jgi:hypothetical protein
MWQCYRHRIRFAVRQSHHCATPQGRITVMDRVLTIRDASERSTEIVDRAKLRSVLSSTSD